MKARPNIAAEVLLAVIIEGAPEEEYGDSLMRDDLGLAYDTQSYPTGYWKSRFLSFLQIDSRVALEAFIQLVNFCTERWAQAARRHGANPVPSLILSLNDRPTREFVGNHRVFEWSQANANHTGQLNSGLAALERWLCARIEAGADITPELRVQTPWYIGEDGRRLADPDGFAAMGAGV